ncbi:hypothetical protein MLD38_034715 [Melastoma candidum]|uniref:Uncharacterized protein n=1 Tax=Melastoma candidum TaxID=119954 RepID=A0ACB9MBG1_9MYRT|nr:hypothetical protein MLD38_034715 [Melastoma candidum]
MERLSTSGKCMRKERICFGRVDLCDFMLEHPTISRFHAVLQFNASGDAYLYDLGSTHGTIVNKKQVKAKAYVDLHVGDVIRFGQSTRLYVFQGPTNLMPPEVDLKAIREAKIREKLRDREASLQRARDEANLADGISWGMGEDAIEEAEEEVDEVTWQTYKGQLTEKQEKTREKVLKRTQKIAHMKKEIDAIRAKDIAQGGLTQGQQTQIARNEQRIAQVLEELENLEETLNDSIRESLGARSGTSTHGRNKGAIEEDETLSDDDDFYDRTKKKISNKKLGENQSVETADTLLDKRDSIIKQIDEQKELLLSEKKRMEVEAPRETKTDTDTGDSLDAYMTGLSSQLILDKTTYIEKEISSLQSELDRINYLLKFADPTGEASKKWSAQKSEAVVIERLDTALNKKPLSPKANVAGENGKAANGHGIKEIEVNADKEDRKPEDAETVVSKLPEGGKFKYTVVKPKWMGAVDDIQEKEAKVEDVHNDHESEQFVDYKDRNNVLSGDADSQTKSSSLMDGSASGLIIRKRKQAHELGGSKEEMPDQSTSSTRGTELEAEDAVALLLKHQKGYYGVDSEPNDDIASLPLQHPDEDHKKPRRIMGPEKPSFLKAGSDYESWMPPEGQLGDGRTKLNDRYGY